LCLFFCGRQSNPCQLRRHLNKVCAAAVSVLIRLAQPRGAISQLQRKKARDPGKPIGRHLVPGSLPPPVRPTAGFLRVVRRAVKPSIRSHFRFRLWTADRQDRPDFLQNACFSPNLWTAPLKYGSRNRLISAGYERQRESGSEISIPPDIDSAEAIRTFPTIVQQASSRYPTPPECVEQNNTHLSDELSPLRLGLR
jgi:hypothetical protein